MPRWSAIARRIRVPLGFAFAAVYAWLARPSFRSLWISLVLIIPGLVVRGLASGHVQKNERLATSGPYAYTRNPLYFGSLILALGFALAARSWWIAGAVVILFLTIYLPVIRAEEQFLRQRFSEFDEYARRVPRLLPRVSPFGAPHGAFSWTLYRKHREYNAALGAAGMFAILIAKLLFMR